MQCVYELKRLGTNHETLNQRIWVLCIRLEGLELINLIENGLSPEET